MTKYIIGEIFNSGRVTLYKNPSDQTVWHYRNAPAGSFLNENLLIYKYIVSMYVLVYV